MRLAWQMVRHRFAGFAGTFVAIALGVAVVAGATTIYLSSRPRAPERYNSSPVLVRSPSVGDNAYGEPEYQSWPAAEATALAARLARLPGVTAAVADPVFYAQRVVGGRPTGDPDQAQLDGHAWSSAALGGYRLSAGAPPRRAGEVALAGAAPGSRVAVLTAAGPATWTVTGTVDGPGFYLADAEALRLSPGVRTIGLTVDGDAEKVASAARAVVGGSGEVVSGRARDSLEPTSVTRVRRLGAQLLIAMVVLGGFVAVFVVASTCALSAAQRRREIGLLRAVGATPGQVRRLMYGETLVVSVLAALAGLPLGALTAPLLAGPLVDTGLEPAGFSVSTQPVALAGSVVLGIVVALAGVGSAARRASRASALDALREAAVERRAMSPIRWVAGAATAGLGALLLVTMPSMATTDQSTAGMGAAMLLLTAAAALAPIVIVPLVRAVTWPWRRAATGMLVREGTLVAVRRVASTAAPVLLTVGFTVLLTGTVATIEDVQGAHDADQIPAATVLAPDGTPGLTEAAVKAQSGASRLPTRILVTQGGNTAGYDAEGGPATEADPSGGAGVVLDEAKAKDLHASVGTALDVRWADGTTSRLPVRAVRAEAGPGILVPRELARRHDPVALTRIMLLDSAPVAAVGARVMSARDYVQVDIDEEGELIDLFLLVLIGLTVGYTGLAVANTLLMATSARHPEFRALRLAGATSGQILRVTAAEALLAVAVGTLLGAAVAVALVIPWGTPAAVIATCAVVALAATAVPVLRQTRSTA
jgi:putative ABC transport system permease protein